MGIVAPLVLLAACSSVSSSSARPSGPVRVVPPDLPPASVQQVTRQCEAVHARLPNQLDPGVAARPTTPQSPLTAAWGDPAISLRCGVPEPEGYRVGATTYGINDVEWFSHNNGDVVQWTTVDRAVYIEVDLPKLYQAALLTEITPAISAVLPAVSPSPRPVPTG